MQIFLQIIPKLFLFYLTLLYVVVILVFSTTYSVFDFIFYLKDFNFTGINYGGVGVEDDVTVIATVPYDEKK